MVAKRYAVSSKLWVWLGWLLSLVAVLVLLAATYDRYASQRIPVDFPAPGDFVRVGEARMHYLCQGTGEPTLVLEAGIGGGLLDWSQLMPLLAEHHRICAFDRLGQDWSDPAPKPRTFATAADELHTALMALGIRRPVVVGHSLGGALVQIYAAKYDVAGVILVDGLTRDVALAVVDRLGSYQSLDFLGRLGILRPMGSLFAYPAYPQEVRKQMIALRSSSAALLHMTEEGALAKQTAVAELQAAEEKLNSPLLVIAAEKSDVPGLAKGAFADAAKALTERKAKASYVLIPDAPHYVQATHPDQVAEAIEAWFSK